MTRIVNTVMLLVVVSLFAAVYHVRYGAEAEFKAIKKAHRAIEEEKVTRRILEAEWVSLNNPARLEVLSEKHLHLEPPAAAQIRTAENFMLTEEERIVRARLVLSAGGEGSDAQ